MPLAAPSPVPQASRVAPRGITVHKVVNRVDEILREHTVPLWVRGEVSGWKRSARGHIFFTLKDDQAELCCVMWGSDAARHPILPRNGVEIVALGTLGIYAKKGEFRLEVTEVEGTGAGGLWQREKEELQRRLREEGLFSDERKRPLPPFPERVGIVTSARSAALQDMYRTLRRKAWWIPLQVFDCDVEGIGAAGSIAAALRALGRTREECPVDVVIVARGGGSIESLWAYNTEEVARAIAACPVPVISAVGHETDYTVADEVADLRAPTPTAGAERAVPDGRRVLELLEEYPRHMHLRVRRSLALQRTGLDRVDGELGRSMRRRLDRLAGEAETLGDGVHGALRRRLDLLGRDLAAAAEALDARSPLRVLARGFAVVDDPTTGRVLRDAADTAPGRELRIRLARGEVHARVERAHPGTP
ncbi:MAG TPA: exodeoxyribonuclease VII large subunit [Longimicrobiaceae bacterium]|nr:exodeoxyribonuclease VII large subunit [Longimicrobiaceae bacterium]